MIVSEPSSTTIYTVEKVPQAIKRSTEFKHVGIFSDPDLVPIVIKGERISVMDTKGETKFTLDPIDGKEIVASLCGFTDGRLAVVNEDGFWGYVDKQGKNVIECNYISVSPFRGGMAFVQYPNETMAVIDTNADEIFKLNLGDELKIINPNGLVVKTEDGRIALVNAKGEYDKLPPLVKEISEFNDKYIIFRKGNGNLGIMSRDADVIISPKYSKLSILDSGNYFFGEQDGHSVLLDSEGEVIQKFDDNKSVNPININQKELVFTSYDSEDGYHSLIDKEGYRITPKYNEMFYLPNLFSIQYLMNRLDSCYGIENEDIDSYEEAYESYEEYEEEDAGMTGLDDWEEEEVSEDYDY